MRFAITWLLASASVFACGAPDATSEISEDPATTLTSELRSGADPLVYSWQPKFPVYDRPFCAWTRPWDDPWVAWINSRTRLPYVIGGVPIPGQPNYREIRGQNQTAFLVTNFPAHLYIGYLIEVAGEPVFTGLGISWRNITVGRSSSSSRSVIVPKGTHMVEIDPLLTRSATATAINAIVVGVAGGQGRTTVGLLGHVTCEM